MNKKLKCSILDISINDNDVKDVNDMQFTKCRIKAFSTGMTSHRYSFIEKVLKDAGNTLLGKPVLWFYSMLDDDASAHESEGVFGKQEIPCGFVPEHIDNANITYEYDAELDKTFIYIDCYIWNLYSGKLLEIFSRTDNKKDVSVELLIVEEIEHEDLNYTEVLKFCFTGISILGEKILPACEGANMKIVSFSEEQKNEYNQAKNQFEKQLYNSKTVNQEPISQSDLDGSFLYCNKDELNKEVNMAKDILENSVEETGKTKTVDNAEVVKNSDSSIVDNGCDKSVMTNSEDPAIIENAEKITHVRVTEDVTTTLYDDNDNFVGEVNEYNTKTTTKIEEVSDEEAKTTAEVILNSEEEIDYKVKFSEMELKCSQLEDENSKLKTDFSVLEIKCSELQGYKNNKENELKVHAIECAINDVVDVLSVEQITDWRNKSVNCSDVNQFMNELKAFAFDIQKNSGIQQHDQLRNSISTPTQTESDNVWDRLNQKY